MQSMKSTDSFGKRREFEEWMVQKSSSAAILLARAADNMPRM